MATTAATVDYKALDPDMVSRELDKVELDKSHLIKGLLTLIIGGALGIIVFFAQIDGTPVFKILYGGFTGIFGQYVYWVVAGLMVLNLCLHVYYRWIKKGQCTGLLAESYNGDGPVFTFFFVLGVIYAIVYALFQFGLVEFAPITSADTGGDVFDGVVVPVLGIILVGACFMPCLLNSGILEIVGVLLEPLMRPLFKIPGKAALDCTASFVTSSSMGVLITNKLYKMQAYTVKEMCAIMTGFSAVSIGFAYLVIDTAGLADHFVLLYAISFVMLLIMAPIMIRIFPLHRKPDTFENGMEQTDADRHEGLRYTAQTLPTGAKRAVTRGAITRGPVVDVLSSLRDGAIVLPKVMAMLSAIGTSAMILAYYTPIFDWIGYIFLPLIQLLQVPDAPDVAPSMMVGITEMFVPVLLIAGKVATMDIKARAFVVLVSMCQIIFFSETGTVMLACKSPIKFWELVVCFLERTLLAMVLAAIAIQIFF